MRWLVSRAATEESHQSLDCFRFESQNAENSDRGQDKKGGIFGNRPLIIILNLSNVTYLSHSFCVFEVVFQPFPKKSRVLKHATAGVKIHSGGKKQQQSIRCGGVYFFLLSVLTGLLATGLKSTHLFERRTWSVDIETVTKGLSKLGSWLRGSKRVEGKIMKITWLQVLMCDKHWLEVGDHSKLVTITSVIFSFRKPTFERTKRQKKKIPISEACSFQVEKNKYS